MASSTEHSETDIIEDELDNQVHESQDSEDELGEEPSFDYGYHGKQIVDAAGDSSKGKNKRPPPKGEAKGDNKEAEKKDDKKGEVKGDNKKTEKKDDKKGKKGKK